MPANRVPTSLKIATGTYRSDRHGDPRTEIKGIKLKKNARPPKELTRELEKQTWRKVIRMLAPKGLATDLDVPAIVEYCRDEVLRDMLYNDIDTRKITIEGDRGSKQNPSFTMLDQVRRRMLMFWSKFGMTPSDRTGLMMEWDPAVVAQTSRPIQQRDRS